MLGVRRLPWTRRRSRSARGRGSPRGPGRRRGRRPCGGGAYEGFSLCDARAWDVVFLCRPARAGPIARRASNEEHRMVMASVSCRRRRSRGVRRRGHVGERYHHDSHGRSGRHDFDRDDGRRRRHRRNRRRGRGMRAPQRSSTRGCVPVGRLQRGVCGLVPDADGAACDPAGHSCRGWPVRVSAAEPARRGVQGHGRRPRKLWGVRSRLPGQTCTFGACAPVVVASGQGSPAYLALDATTVYGPISRTARRARPRQAALRRRSLLARTCPPTWQWMTRTFTGRPSSEDEGREGRRRARGARDRADKGGRDCPRRDFCLLGHARGRHGDEGGKGRRRARDARVGTVVTSSPWTRRTLTGARTRTAPSPRRSSGAARP